MRRLFFALWLEADPARQLLESAQALKQGQARSVPAADLHLTLCFLGQVDDSALSALCERVAALEPQGFELEFEALEYWPRAKIVAATAARTPAAASALAESLCAAARAVGLGADDQPFRPHVTLLRRAALGRRPRSFPLEAPLQLPARCFHLAQSQQLEATTAAGSQAARYLRLATWPLRPQAPSA